MKQLVSILIPVFNAEKWICACIESALGQTWPWKEIIIVDDGSRDASLKIAQTYASNNVKVVAQVNKGASAARNHALSLAQGDYIQWLDADDLLTPDKIALQLKDAESGQISRVLLSGAWGKFYHHPEKAEFKPDALWTNLDSVEWLYRKIDLNLWMAIESWLVSRSLTEMTGPWNENLSLDDDGEYFCRVLSCSERLRFIPESRSLCRKGTFGISNTLSLTDSKLDSQLASLHAYIKIMRSMEDSPRTRSACLRLLNRWAIFFYPNRLDLLQQMQTMATELGGKLDTPQLREKYRWVQKLLGWRLAKKAQNTMPSMRSIVESNREWLQSIFHK